MNLTIERSCLVYLSTNLTYILIWASCIILFFFYCLIWYRYRSELTIWQLTRSYLSWNQSIWLIDLSLHRYGYFLWRRLTIAAVAALFLNGSVGVAIPWIVNNSFLITVRVRACRLFCINYLSRFVFWDRWKRHCFALYVKIFWCYEILKLINFKLILFLF